MKRWRRILFGAAVVVLALWLGGRLLLHSWFARPPPLPAEAAMVLQRTVVEHDGKRWVGRCWLGEREGLSVLYLTGTPFEIGYANGLLTQDRIHRLEDAAINLAHRWVPHEWALELLKDYVVYRNRHLPKFVTLRYQIELLGMIHGCPDVHPEIGPYFARVLCYHAAHDISYMLIDNPLVAVGGCTAFGAWGDATAGGHLVTGRNFDWEADPVFDRDRLLVMCEPDEGIPFISLSWAGMVGVVSGMNRAGVSVTLNGAPSELPKEVGTPAALVARDILQHAHNLTEATTILREAHVFVSTLWLVGSRVDGRFIVVEKTPECTHVRESRGDEIVCANHFLTDGLKDVLRNVKFTSESTSSARYTRMSELLENSRGKLTIPRTVEILRDRNLVGGVFAGDGHRSSLNAFIATHSTAMDLTDGLIWAASPPRQLGKFVAFDVNDFSRQLPGQTVPADAVLTSNEFARYEQAQKCLSDAQHALKQGDSATALSLAEQAETLNPGFYQNAALKGRALLALGRQEEATHAFTAALAGKPSFAKERRELELLLEQARTRH
jgi:isopenicillin-N N-acyltransferase like protein